MVDISNLDLNIDITVASPEDYADNTPAALPMGTYNFTIKSFDLDRDQQGNPKFTRNGAPVILLKQLEVAEGDLAGRRLGFQRIYTSPYKRKKADGTEVVVSQLGDLIRSIDRSATWTSLQDALDILQRAQDTNQSFKARVTYRGFDKDYFEAQLSAQGVTRDSEEGKKLAKEATLVGKKGFPNGTPVAQGPSGRTIEGRPELSDFYPAKDGE